MTKNFDEYGVDGTDLMADDDAPQSRTRSGLPSVFATLRAELEKPIGLEEDFVYKVRGREIDLRISADLPVRKLNRWRVASTNKKNGLVDQLMFSRLIIVGQTKCLVINGENCTDDDGTWLNFSHKDVIDSLDALDYHAAVDKFFGRDAEVIRCGNEILEKAGYGEDEDFNVDEEDEGNDPLA